jgi:hypothetical protein
MRQSIGGRRFRQVQQARERLVEQPDLCFGGLLSGEHIQEALCKHALVFRERLYSPSVTLWTFLYQVLCPDHSCRCAVARLLAQHGAGQFSRASAATGAYCKARERIPEALIADLARQSAAALEARCPASALLDEHRVRIIDGTTLSMPDTPENQARYPQQPSQKPGLGFPILRLVAVMSLRSGCVLDVACGAYAGKKTGETSLLRQLLDHFAPGDVAIADGMFANYWTIADLQARQADLVFKADGKRHVDFRTGERLGEKDHVVVWRRPQRPEWMSEQEYRQMPETLKIRETQVIVAAPGSRVRRFVVITTLLDQKKYPKEELAKAYYARWHAELDLRSIKQAMGMDVLRCKSPAMVRKEIWMHLLAYNLVRTLLADAALESGIQPRELSFQGGLQTLNAFAAVWRGAGDREALYERILKAIAFHRVGNRPHRFEPRKVKRRPKKLVFLTEPRYKARRRLLRRG